VRPIPAAKALRSQRRSGASIGSCSAAMCRLQRPRGSALRRARRHSAPFQAKIASDRIKAPSSYSARVKPLRTVQLAVRRCVFQPLGEGITWPCWNADDLRGTLFGLGHTRVAHCLWPTMPSPRRWTHKKPKCPLLHMARAALRLQQLARSMGWKSFPERSLSIFCLNTIGVLDRSHRARSSPACVDCKRHGERCSPAQRVAVRWRVGCCPLRILSLMQSHSTCGGLAVTSHIKPTQPVFCTISRFDAHRRVAARSV